MNDADNSGDDGIVLEKRSGRLQAFCRKATPKAYALPWDSYRYKRYTIKESHGNSDRKDNPAS